MFQKFNTSPKLAFATLMSIQRVVLVSADQGDRNATHAEPTARVMVQVAELMQSGQQRMIGKQNDQPMPQRQADRRQNLSRRFRASPQRLTPKQRPWRGQVQQLTHQQQLQHSDHQQPVRGC